MHKCFQVEGGYFEGILLWYISIFFNKVFITPVSLLFDHTLYIRSSDPFLENNSQLFLLLSMVTLSGYVFVTFCYPSFIRPKKSLKDLLPDAPDDAIDLMTKLLVFNPEKRLSAEECLSHPYVAKCVISLHGFFPNYYKVSSLILIF